MIRLGLAPLTLLALLVLSLAMRLPTASAQQDSLIVITPIGSSMTDPVADAFKAWYKAKTGRDVAVSFIRGGTPTLYARIKAWAGKPEGDIFWGGSPDMYDDLLALGLLLSHKSPEAEALPTEFVQGIPLKEKEGNWYVLSFYGLGVIFNDKLLADKGLPKPSSWEDLLHPRYRGLITFTTPAKSGTMHNLVELFLQRRGEEEGWGYWRMLAANLGKWAGRSFDVFVAVKTGEATIGIAQAEEFAVSARADGIPISYSYMDLNTMIPSPIAILKGALNEGPARHFVDYLLTKEAHMKMAEVGFIPSRPDVKFSEVPTKKAQLMKEVLGADSIWELRGKFQPLNFVLSTARYSEVNRIFDDTIFKPWEKLKAAWLKVEEAREIIEGFKKQGAEMARSLTILSETIRAFKAGKYDDAVQLAQRAISTAEAEFKEFQLRKQQEAELRQRVVDLERQVKDLESKLTEARSQLQIVTGGLYVAVALVILLPLAVFFTMRRKTKPEVKVG